MRQQTWLDDELTLAGALRQGAELLFAGFRRSVLTLPLIAVFGAALGAAVVWGKHEYAPRFVLRVIEADRDPGSMPRLSGQLNDYVRQAIFTSAPLFDVIERNGLYPNLMRHNPRAALDSLREDISLEVYRNYFVEQRAPGELPRSARLALSYHSRDRVQALAVTRELGNLIISHELEVRRAQALEAARAAEIARDSAQLAVQQRSEEALSMQRRIREAKAPDPELQVELVGLLGSLDSLERRAETTERRAASLDLGAAFEKRGIGLSFEVVDDASLASGHEQQREREWLGAAGFALGIPLVAMAVGAFAPKRGRSV
ncbi:MAG TPA: hypothetical protein VGM29_14590 [Polyangiaceae bacterium]|jgi:hypothetical protein